MVHGEKSSKAIRSIKNGRATDGGNSENNTQIKGGVLIERSDNLEGSKFLNNRTSCC